MIVRTGAWLGIDQMDLSADRDHAFSPSSAGSHEEMLDANHLRQWTVTYMKAQLEMLDARPDITPQSPIHPHWTWPDYLGDNGHLGTQAFQS